MLLLPGVQIAGLTAQYAHGCAPSPGRKKEIKGSAFASHQMDGCQMGQRIRRTFDLLFPAIVTGLNALAVMRGRHDGHEGIRRMEALSKAGGRRICLQWR
jgi:hypothetical protein